MKDRGTYEPQGTRMSSCLSRLPVHPVVVISSGVSGAGRGQSVVVISEHHVSCSPAAHLTTEKSNKKIKDLVGRGGGGGGWGVVR